MSDFTGANPDELDALARTMDECAERLDETCAALDRAGARTTWSGSDAADFRSSWVGHRRRLRQAGDELADRATFVRAQAEDQRRASASGPEAVFRGLPTGSALRDAVSASSWEAFVTPALGSDGVGASVRLGHPDHGKQAEAVHLSKTGGHIGAGDGVAYAAETAPRDLVASLHGLLGAAGRPTWLPSR